MNQLKLTVTVFLLFIGVFCSPVPDTTPELQEDKQWIPGKIVYVDLEGGFYAIIAYDGSRYNPVNLPEKFQKDGLHIRFSGSPERKAASIQMWGTLYRIREIEELPPQE